MNNDSEKLDDLSERIRQVQAGAEAKIVAQKANMRPAGNAGYDLLGGILGGGVLGYCLDSLFGTSPWCLVGMILFGFVTGIVGVWRSMQNAQGKDDLGKDN